MGRALPGAAEMLADLVRRSEAGEIPWEVVQTFAAGPGGGTPVSHTAEYIAKQEEEKDKAAVEAKTRADRINQETPWGNLTYTQADDGTWTQTTTLNPEARDAFDAQNRVTTGRSQIAEGLLTGLGGIYNQPMDWGSLPELPDAQGYAQRGADAYYQQAQSRLDPQWNESADALRSRLYNQGFREGDEGYDKAMANFARDRNDAYSSAQNASILTGNQLGQSLFGMGMQGRQQAIGEAMTQRNQPLNEVNALLSGQQISMPSFPGYSQAGQAQPANLLAANALQYGRDMDRYNASQGQDPFNQLMGAAATYGPLIAAASDERVKTKIQRLDVEAIPGVPAAVFQYKDRPGETYVGVIAQDLEKVSPERVFTREDGIKMVGPEFAPIRIGGMR